MSFIKKLFSKSKKQSAIAICGLDNAGKTTMVNYLETGTFTQTTPTLGMNLEKISLKNVEISIFDLGGQEIFRRFWDKAILGANSLIFVIDSVDRDRLDEVKTLFWQTQEKLGRKLPLLIFVHKCDLMDHLTKEEIIEYLDLEKLTEIRTWHIQETSAKSGRGLPESFAWLYEQITGKKITGPVTLNDLIVYSKDGICLASKSNLFNEPVLTAGLLSAINTFVLTISDQTLDTVTMGDYKILFSQLKDVIGAIILNTGDDEIKARIIIQDLINKIQKTDIKDAEKVLYSFIMNDIKKYL